MEPLRDADVNFRHTLQTCTSMYTHTEALCPLNMKELKELRVSTKIPPGNTEKKLQKYWKKTVNPKHFVHIFTHM